MTTIEIIAAALLSFVFTLPFLRFWPRIVKAWWNFLTTLAGDDMEEEEHDNG